MHELEAQLNQLSAQEGLALIADLFPGRVTFSTSLGQEDQVITQLIADAHLPISIFSLDTGRLFPETLELLSKKLNIQLEYTLRFQNTFLIKIKTTGQIENTF